MLEEDLNDTQLVGTASAVTSDLGQSERLSDRDSRRCRAHFVASIIDRNKDGDNHTLYMLHSLYPPYFYQVSSVLLEGHRSSLRCGPLLRVIGCHEDEYFVRPVLIKIDNCAELSSGDDSWDEFIIESFDHGLQRAFLMICSMAL